MWTRRPQVVAALLQALSAMFLMSGCREANHGRAGSDSSVSPESAAADDGTGETVSLDEATVGEGGVSMDEALSLADRASLGNPGDLRVTYAKPTEAVAEWSRVAGAEFYRLSIAEGLNAPASCTPAGYRTASLKLTITGLKAATHYSVRVCAGVWINGKRYLSSGSVASVETVPASGQSGSLPYGFISGLAIANDSGAPNTTILVSRGSARDSSGTVDIVLTSPLPKAIDRPFAAGGGNGGAFFTETVAPATWYHVFVIKDKSSGAVDVGFDDDANGNHIPAASYYKRRIASVMTDATSQLRRFMQIGDEFLWKDKIMEASPCLLKLDSTHSINGGSTFYGDSILCSLTVPTGIQVWANVSYIFAGPGGTTTSYPEIAIVISNPSQNNPNVAVGGLEDIRWHPLIRRPTLNGYRLTDTSGRVQVIGQANTTSTPTTVGVLRSVQGWRDPRP